MIVEISKRIVGPDGLYRGDFFPRLLPHFVHGKFHKGNFRVIGGGKGDFDDGHYEGVARCAVPGCGVRVALTTEKLLVDK